MNPQNKQTRRNQLIYQQWAEYNSTYERIGEMFPNKGKPLSRQRVEKIINAINAEINTEMTIAKERKRIIEAIEKLGEITIAKNPLWVKAQIIKIINNKKKG